MLPKTVIYDYVNNLTSEYINVEIVRFVFGDIVRFYVEDGCKKYYIDSEDIKSLRYTKYTTESKSPLPRFTSDGRLTLKLIKILGMGVSIFPIRNLFTVSTENFSVTDKTLSKAVAKSFLMEIYFQRDFLPILDN